MSEAVPPSGAAEQTIQRDILLDCLLLAGEFLQRRFEPQQLTHGLLAPGELLSIEQLPQALARADLEAEAVRVASPAELPAALAPVILPLADGGWCVWLGLDARSGLGRVITPSVSEAVALVEMDSVALDDKRQGWALRLPLRWTQAPQPGAHLLPDGWFVQLLSRNRGIYGYALLATVLVNLFALAVPFFTMAVYDRVLPNNALTSLTALAIGAVLVLTLDFVLKNLRGYLIDSAGRRLDHSLGVAVFSRLLRMKESARTQPTGQLANTIRDYESLRNFFSSASITLLGDLPFALLFIGVICAVGGPLGLWPLAGLLTVMGFSYALHLPLKRLVEEGQQDSTEKSVLIYETLSGVETLKALGAEFWSRQRWQQLIGVTVVNQQSHKLYSSLATHFAALMQGLVSIVVVVHGAFLVAAGEITTGVLIAAVMLGGRATATSGQLANLLVSFYQTRLSYRMIDQLMSAESEEKPLAETIAVPSLRGKVDLKGVSFAYPGRDLPVLDGVDFNIKPGERVGILGRIGSGKSSLLKLLMNLQQPSEGRVLLDDLALGHLDTTELRRHIGYMPQENHLFSASLRTNLTLRNPTLRDSEIMPVLEALGLSTVVQSAEQGLDLPIGERGGSLSGGQRQLVCLARAMVGNPNLILLDEPTSLLDNNSEIKVLQGLQQLTQGRTLVLVTHRPQVLALVDRLIVLDAGKVVADGPKADVLRALQYRGESMESTGATTAAQGS